MNINKYTEFEVKTAISKEGKEYNAIYIKVGPVSRPIAFLTKDQMELIKTLFNK